MIITVLIIFNHMECKIIEILSPLVNAIEPCKADVGRRINPSVIHACLCVNTLLLKTFRRSCQVSCCFIEYDCSIGKFQFNMNDCHLCLYWLIFISKII